tara:strand:- start:13 stop:276 length:264 start_codon:yes stop_codon:yes gene_type:complete
MKIFIYKTAIITIVFAITFEILIGSRINDFKKQINEITTKQNREKIMIKIKDEIQKANQKENYFTEDEKVLFSTFLKKIFKELDLAN